MKKLFEKLFEKLYKPIRGIENTQDFIRSRRFDPTWKPFAIFWMCFAVIPALLVLPYQLRQEQARRDFVYLANLKSDSEELSEAEIESGKFTLVEKVETILASDVITLTKQEEREFLRRFDKAAPYFYVTDLNLAKKPEGPGPMFIIHAADGNRIQVSVWDKYLEVDGVIYEAEEAVCKAISDLHPMYTTVPEIHYLETFPAYQYTASQSYAFDDRTLILEDIPENMAEELVVNYYLFTAQGDFGALYGLSGSETLRISSRNEEMQFAQGVYHTETVVHDLSTLAAEDLTPKGDFFTEDYLIQKINQLTVEHDLHEYTVVYVDRSRRWSEAGLQAELQVADGRYERLFLLGRPRGGEKWLIYELFGLNDTTAL